MSEQLSPNNKVQQDSPPKSALNVAWHQPLESSLGQEASKMQNIRDEIIMNRLKAEELLQQEQGAKYQMHGEPHYFAPNSLCCLGKDNLFRRGTIWIITWNWFENFITVVICIQSVVLAARDYQWRLKGDDQQHSPRNDYLDEMGKILSLIFIIECILKIIGMGFVMHKLSYMRNSWNVLDFFVVIPSLLDFELFPALNQLSSLKVLRTFRILRPLRSVNKIKRMKMLINSLLKSLPGLFNVVIFLVFVLSIFGIFATNQFKGFQYSRCRKTEFATYADGIRYVPIPLRNESCDVLWPKFDTDWLCSTPAQCNTYLNTTEEVWCGRPEDQRKNGFDLIETSSDQAANDELIMWNIINFDDFFSSMRSIFVAITLEGWVLMMYNYSDSNSPWLSSGFFILLVIFGAFFALNLVLAEVMESFYASRAEDVELEAKKLMADKKEQEENLNERESEAAQEEQKQEAQMTLISPKAHNMKNASLTIGAVEYDSTGDFKKRTNMEISSFPDIEPLNSIGSRGVHDIMAAEREQEQSIDSMHRRPFTIDPQPISIMPDNLLTYRTDQPLGIREQQSETAKKVVSFNDQIDEVPLQVKKPIIVEIEEEENLEHKVEEEQDKCARKRAKVNKFYNFFFQIVTAPGFNFLIFILILLNTMVLAMDDYYMTESKTLFVSIANQFFTFAFLFEMCLKLIGLGPTNYIKDSFNLFDAIVVTLSLVDWVLTLVINEDDIGDAADALQALRALRLLRIVKLARSWTNLQDILRKTALSLVDIFYFTILLLLFMFIFSLLGMELFANYCRFTPEGDLIQNVQLSYAKNQIMAAPRANFDSIGEAMITVFIIILGEDWPGVMYNYMRVYDDKSQDLSWPVSIFFMACFTIGNFMLLSLFVAILLSNFENSDDDEVEDGENQEDVSTTNVSNIVKSKTFSNHMDHLSIDLRYQYICAFGTTQNINDAMDTRQIELDRLQRRMDVEGENTVQVFPLMNDSKEHSSREVKSLQIDAEEVLHAPEECQHPKRMQSSLAHTSVHYSEMDKMSKLKSNKKTLNIKGNSLWCFASNNGFRRLIFNIVNHAMFDWIILIFICVSTIMLAMEAPLDNPHSEFVWYLQQLDMIMTGIFILEMVMKIIALGFLINGKDSYMRDPWSVLDFFIVLISIISIVSVTYDISFLKALRMLRILKPLRMLTMIRSLKLAIVSLFKSIPDILNLLMIVLFFIFMLAILCTTLFKGKFYRCYTDELGKNLDQADRDRLHSHGIAGERPLITDKWDCLNYGGEWINADLNFDTTITSMITLFTVQSTEGWIDVMWSAVDGVGYDMAPIVNYQRAWIFFFLILILLLCMLFLNLFVGVVCETFNAESDKLSLNHLITSDKKQWIKVQIMSYRAKPLIKLLPNVEEFGRFRSLCIIITNSPVFDCTIMSCIMLNTCALGTVWYEMDLEIVKWLEYLNFAFMITFTIEAIIKLIALRCKYFNNGWNCFDFTVVIGSLAAVIFSFVKTDSDIAMQATTVRILRVLRVLRIIKRAQKLQIIFETIVAALPGMFSLGLLLLMMQFLFAVIGMQSFGLVKLQDELNYHANFQTFGNSFLLLMRCATGEGWNALMFDTARQNSITFQCNKNDDFEWEAGKVRNYVDGCGSQIAMMYFISFQVIVSQVFLNLFIAIVVDTFVAMKAAHELPVTQLDIDTFVDIWCKYDPTATGYIHWRKLEDLVVDLHESETSFFSQEDDALRTKELTQNLLAFLEIPLHKSLSSCLFYDVLAICCRYTVENKHKDIIKRRKELALELQVAYRFQGRNASEVTLARRINFQMRNDAESVKIFNKLFCTTDIDPKSEIKLDLLNASKPIIKRFQIHIDPDFRTQNDNNQFVEQENCYTTKQCYAVCKIYDIFVNRIKAHRIERKNNGSKSVSQEVSSRSVTPTSPRGKQTSVKQNPTTEMELTPIVSQVMNEQNVDLAIEVMGHDIHQVNVPLEELSRKIEFSEQPATLNIPFGIVPSASILSMNDSDTPFESSSANAQHSKFVSDSNRDLDSEVQKSAEHVYVLKHKLTFQRPQLLEKTINPIPLNNFLCQEHHQTQPREEIPQLSERNSSDEDFEHSNKSAAQVKWE